MMIAYAKQNSCINSQCDNNGVLVVMGRDGEPEQEQCEYCYRVRFPEIETYRQTLTATHNNAIQMAMGKVPPEEVEECPEEDNCPFCKRGLVSKCPSGDRRMEINEIITQMNKGLSELIIEQV